MPCELGALKVPFILNVSLPWTSLQERVSIMMCPAMMCTPFSFRMTSAGRGIFLAARFYFPWAEHVWKQRMFSYWALMLSCNSFQQVRLGWKESESTARMLQHPQPPPHPFLIPDLLPSSLLHPCLELPRGKGTSSSIDRQKRGKRRLICHWESL